MALRGRRSQRRARPDQSDIRTKQGRSAGDENSAQDNTAGPPRSDGTGANCHRAGEVAGLGSPHWGNPNFRHRFNMEEFSGETYRAKQGYRSRPRTNGIRIPRGGPQPAQFRDRTCRRNGSYQWLRGSRAVREVSAPDSCRIADVAHINRGTPIP